MIVVVVVVTSEKAVVRDVSFFRMAALAVAGRVKKRRIGANI
jgi:fumarate reductase subunit C